MKKDKRLPIVKAELELLVLELKHPENTSFDVSRVTLEALLEIAVIAMRQQLTLTRLERGLESVTESLEGREPVRVAKLPPRVRAQRERRVKERAARKTG